MFVTNSKVPYRDSTTVERRSHVHFEPPGFIACLAALVTKPRINHTRLHGVFTSSSTVFEGQQMAHDRQVENVPKDGF
jgi:hypothetical protein